MIKINHKFINKLSHTIKDTGKLDGSLQVIIDIVNMTIDLIISCLDKEVSVTLNGVTFANNSDLFAARFISISVDTSILDDNQLSSDSKSVSKLKELIKTNNAMNIVIDTIRDNYFIDMHTYSVQLLFTQSQLISVVGRNEDDVHDYIESLIHDTKCTGSSLTITRSDGVVIKDIEIGQIKLIKN